MYYKPDKTNPGTRNIWESFSWSLRKDNVIGPLMSQCIKIICFIIEQRERYNYVMDDKSLIKLNIYW